jgi:hypothetical protein
MSIGRSTIGHWADCCGRAVWQFGEWHVRPTT